MSADPGDHAGVFYGGNDLQGAATLGTFFNIDFDTRLRSRAQLMRAGAELLGGVTVNVCS